VQAQTHDGRTLRILTLIDERSRACLALKVARRINSLGVIEALADAMCLHGIPEHVRCDNVLRSEEGRLARQQGLRPRTCARGVIIVNVDPGGSCRSGRTLGHSEHRIQPMHVAPWSSPSSTRDVDPGRRPEHCLQGRGSHALTALLRGVLPPGTGPSTKGR
jgi:hypothetical protein